ncbi:hypothetical protein CISIN_1g048349mg [Citrus sinensis]|uniref:HMA domain-containing protein n=1 Tax=Citrus sinensis TaxID=2711 RepID=A0A067DNR7_CITSI|nr:hypothetical protein CISIN_1g048349mg [Citrus sinensis]
MKRMVGIEQPLENDKSRSKALKIVGGMPGVESVAFKGDDRSQIEVTGDGMDAIVLFMSLRKKLRYATFIASKLRRKVFLSDRSLVSHHVYHIEC